MDCKTIIQTLHESDRDSNWLETNYPNLIKTHNNMFIAINDEEIIAENKELNVVLKQIKKQKMNPENVLVQFISKTKIIL